MTSDTRLHDKIDWSVRHDKKCDLFELDSIGAIKMYEKCEGRTAHGSKRSHHPKPSVS